MRNFGVRPLPNLKGTLTLGLSFLMVSLMGSKTMADETIVPSEFALNVTRHVLYHEAAHALIREFGLPVLANEEAMADSFATLWIAQQQRDDAPGVVVDRVKSWLFEDSEVDPEDYDFKGEHPLDIRRAYQVACLFYGQDPADFGSHVKFLDFSRRDLADCSDTAPDQQESWNRVLSPHLLEAGQTSRNVEVVFGEGPMKKAMQATGVVETFAKDLARFNWPETITIHFDHCDRGAFWSRSDRKILLCDSYVQRFINQGESIVNQ